MVDKGWDILVGVPIHMYQGSYRFRDCLDNALAYTYSKGYTLKIVWKQSSLLPKNRIAIVEEAIKHEARYTMMFDCDQIFDKDIILRLLSHGKPIVSALYFSKTPPYKPVMMRGIKNHLYNTVLEWKEGDLIEVDTCGGGGLLIETAVFNRIPRPWFCTPPIFFYYDGKEKRFRINEEYYADKNLDNNELVGEDVWFCHIARESGFPVHVDTAAVMGHLGDHVFCDDEFHLAVKEGLYDRGKTDCKKIQ